MPLTETQLIELRSAPATQGNRLAIARRLAGLTQVALSEAIGITQSSLSDLERQRYSSPMVTTAQKFSTFFGCAIEDLFPARDHQEVA